MEYKLILDTAVLAGELMLQSGAETYRVEDTMCHILKTSKMESIEAFALMTGIVATINGPELENPITVVKTVNERNTNLNHIVKVNEISRRYCGGRITLEEAYEQLKDIQEELYSKPVFHAATVAITAGFAMMFGGSLLEVLVAAVTGLWLASCMLLGKKIRISAILQDIFSCMGIAVLSMASKRFWLPTINMDIVIVSALMPIVPGVAITNAIRDTLQGDYLSGCARILEAFLKAASIALGIVLGMAIGGMIL